MVNPEESDLFDGLEEADYDFSPQYSSEFDGAIPQDTSLLEGIAFLILAVLVDSLEDPELVAGVLDLEHERQEELLEDGHHKAAIVRQAGLFEWVLNAHIEERWAESQNAPLSGNQKQYIRSLPGIRHRINIASMLGALDESEEDIFRDLLSARNEVVHNPWFSVDPDRDEQLERLATEIHNYIQDLAQDRERLDMVSDGLMDQME